MPPETVNRKVAVDTCKISNAAPVVYILMFEIWCLCC